MCIRDRNPASDAKREELIDKPAFGQVFSDSMAHMTWTKGEGWSDRRIEPYAPLKLDPGASVLHYAQECFEGLKAYRHADGSTWLFRPDANAERMQNSAKRLYLPEVPIEDFLGSCAALVERDVKWVPSRREYTLYLRPFLFASEPFLVLRLCSVAFNWQLPGAVERSQAHLPHRIVLKRHVHHHEGPDTIQHAQVPSTTMDAADEPAPPADPNGGADRERPA